MSVRRIPAATDHRPWPVPPRPWAMRMNWHELLFAHWPVEREALRAALPGPFSEAIDTFEGSAWLGVVPFGMRDVRPRGWPRHVPYRQAWAFPELNVRTYITIDGKPGVYFFSLDAASRLAVRAARWSWNLAYYDAAMWLDRRDDGWVHFTSERTHRGAPSACLAARYRPTGPAAQPTTGSFEHFATERYCLYTVDRRGRMYRGDIHHAPWPLRPAEAHFDVLQMTDQIDLALPTMAPRLHYADELDVVAWLPRRVTAG